MKWIKFDLHQHTKDELLSNREKYDSNYTHVKFRDLVKSQGLKLKAVTNHNKIDVVEHVKYALICESIEVAYLPGVEMDYKFGNEKFHAISILNPLNNIIDYSNKLDKITSQIDPDKHITLNKDHFADLHENSEFIFIPHYAKEEGIKPNQETLLELEENWVVNMIASGHSIPVIFENTQEHHKHTVHAMFREKMKNIELDYVPCYTGTDYKFDDDFERKERAEGRLIYMMFAEPTYRGLEIAIRNYKQRITSESQVIERNNYIKRIKFSKNINFGLINDIELSPSLNVIIGSSGSGKTLLLNEIFFSITGRNLQDVNSKSKDKTSSAYYDKIKEDKWLEIINKTNKKDLKVFEISNLYKKLISNLDNPRVLGKVFDIDDTSKAEKLIESFINDVVLYEKNIKDSDELRNKANVELNDISDGIDFISSNKGDSSDYQLNEIIIDETRLVSLNNEVNSIQVLIDKKTEYFTYLDKIVKILGTTTSENYVNKIRENYEFLVKELLKRKVELDESVNIQKYEDKLQEIVNCSIKEQMNNIGARNKLVSEQHTLIERKISSLTDYLKSYVKNVYLRQSMCLSFPFTELQETLDRNNSNNYARYQLDFKLSEIEKVDIKESRFIKNASIKTKLADIYVELGDISLIKNSDLENFISLLINSDLSFKDIFTQEGMYNIQLKVKNEWENASEINPGDVSKVSMRFYFNDILNNKQPDVLFIDQPENDLDKDFITNVLSEFIRDSKLKQQIILTSHDPILTINSDVNTIIESRINSENKISYEGFKVEDLENGKFVTDKVAKILDGSKKNIMNRYNIYGGILRNEN